MNISPQRNSSEIKLSINEGDRESKNKFRIFLYYRILFP